MKSHYYDKIKFAELREDRLVPSGFLTLEWFAQSKTADCQTSYDYKLTYFVKGVSNRLSLIRCELLVRISNMNQALKSRCEHHSVAENVREDNILAGK